ncbi:N-acetylmuramoyl-L-alanine amidase LytC precursor [Dermatophilus congolensis]|uniref:N-acetylmuramoyl-L-alanine amidase LytC n=1 Tax=Dermatophilus congolensis TaxID=1863 RepID=A0AA46BLB3_9MICO|nr:cell wall-binding repeat-containing protein [Dermatophilus congolensis]STD03769.1 N-acetylmuramoyl-L-alanine amidase LytC precursor [Dermatophilus congolensis]
MRSFPGTLTRPSIAIAAALTLTGVLGSPLGAAASAQTTASTAATHQGRLAKTTHVYGVNTKNGSPIQGLTVEVAGAPVVSGTAADGTNITTSARKDLQSLTNQLRQGTGASVHAAATSTVPRLGAESVYDSAVAISQRAWQPGKADTVYITRGDRVTDALSAGSFSDGPILMVPSTGAAPNNVRQEIDRLAPSQVIALGGESAVSAETLQSAAQGRNVSRLSGANSYETAAAIARRAFPGGAEEVYLAGLGQVARKQVQSSPDAAAAGALTKGPVLPVPHTGQVPTAIKNVIAQLNPRKVYALGGSNVVTPRALTLAAAGRSTGRLAGVDRYTTSAAIARHAFPSGSKVAYLVSTSRLQEAVLGGSLSDGPTLFVPPAGAKYTKQASTVAGALKVLGVRYVGALSPASALSNTALAAVLTKAPNVTNGPLPAYPGGSDTVLPPAPTPNPAPAADTCESLITSFRPVPMSSKYSIKCVDSIDGNPNILGLTTSYTYSDTGELANGVVEINRNQSITSVKQTIAHELSHAYSYAYLSSAQRAWFVTELRKVDSGVINNDFGGSDYDHMPAEQWARGQAKCVGWGDPFNRPTASCSLINGAINYGS